MSVVRHLGVVLVLGLAASACGGDASAEVDVLDGADVGRMAEHQLEVENARMARGDLACPDLDFEVGAEVRCVRTTELSGGRFVVVHGTVEVTSVESGGRLHVAMDHEASSFGRTGDAVAAELSRRYADRFDDEPEEISCPDLPGELGAVVTCAFEVGGTRQEMDAAVTAVVPARFETAYRFRPHRDPS